MRVSDADCPEIVLGGNPRSMACHLIGDANDVKPIWAAINEIAAVDTIFNNTNINEDGEAYSDYIK